MPDERPGRQYKFRGILPVKALYPVSPEKNCGHRFRRRTVGMSRFDALCFPFEKIVFITCPVHLALRFTRRIWSSITAMTWTIDEVTIASSSSVIASSVRNASCTVNWTFPMPPRLAGIVR